MTLTVTAHVFSGRPDPVWIVPEPEAQEFRHRIAALKVTSNLKAIDGRGDLGYRGFSVHDHTSGHSAHVFNSIVDPAHGLPSLIADSEALETWLLQSGAAQLHPDVTQHINRALTSRLSGPILKNVPFTAAGVTCPTCHAQDAPAYNPGAWNTPTVQPYNNCYNYANNRVTNTFAQPGRATGHPTTSMSCAGTSPSAISDGLVSVGGFGGALGAGKGYYVALVIWPGQDFHWYRQDAVGCWSHKPGSTAVRNVDNAGQSISDPASANRGPYTDFCGYMITTAGVRIS